jgi:deoxyribonuclease V
MKAVLDVHYYNQIAHAACIEFVNWSDAASDRTTVTSMKVPSDYRPGKFFRRELPCLLAVLKKANRHFESIIIDGYVFLKPPTVDGLGAYLERALPYSPGVIGVAKNPLRMADRFVAITRGRSKKPLYISSLNIPLKEAAELVAGMDGAYRIPTLIRLADKASRGA